MSPPACQYWRAAPPPKLVPRVNPIGIVVSFQLRPAVERVRAVAVAVAAAVVVLARDDVVLVVGVDRHRGLVLSLAAAGEVGIRHVLAVLVHLDVVAATLRARVLTGRLVVLRGTAASAGRCEVARRAGVVALVALLARVHRAARGRRGRGVLRDLRGRLRAGVARAERRCERARDVRPLHRVQRCVADTASVSRRHRAPTRSATRTLTLSADVRMSGRFIEPSLSCNLQATGATGLEPATSGVTGRRSNRLNYAPGWRLRTASEHTATTRHPDEGGRTRARGTMASP